MENVEAEISRLIEALEHCTQAFHIHWDEHDNQEPNSGHSPPVLIEALENLLELLYRYESDPNLLQPHELNELGDYGLTLLDTLARDTESLEFPAYQLFEDLTFPLALWLARHNAEIDTLGPVVNAMARIANRLSNPEELENLFSQSSEIGEAISVSLTQNLDSMQPGAPWPIYILNRGIISTRTLNTEMMEVAFDAICDMLHDSAQQFFTEAMEQMELLDYPPHVRSVVERYYNECNNHKRLH